jgi:FtsP/CotA-like multicopper oxidase with cupredoxin domain
LRSNASIALVGVAGSIVVVVTFSTALNRGPLNAQDSSKRENFGGHSPGYPILGTTGDVLDPISLNIDPKTAVVGPMKYLREFNYGRASKLSNGTSLREFTLVASDQQTKEVSPGVFYNVWMFNGTIPGPTIRATEADLVRITLINIYIKKNENTIRVMNTKASSRYNESFGKHELSIPNHYFLTTLFHVRNIVSDFRCQ